MPPKPRHPAAYEYVIENENGQLLEGFGSNFYAIMDDGLYTAPDGTVLGGISRKITLQVAPDVCAVHMQPITTAQTNHRCKKPS